MAANYETSADGRATGPGIGCADLGEQTAVIWMARPEAMVAPPLVKQFHGLLDVEERTRHHQFRFERDRHVYLVAHALLRIALSYHFRPVPPHAWSFVRTDDGRPEVRPGNGLAVAATDSPRFNLTHTTGLVACIIAKAVPVGIDAEAATSFRNPEELADESLSASEAAHYRRSPAAARPGLMARYWTLKEAYLKARGLGVSVPMRLVTLLLDRADSAGARFDPALGDDPAAWQFCDFTPGAGHRVAAAIRRGHGPPFTIGRYVLDAGTAAAMLSDWAPRATPGVDDEIRL